jgi:putative transposase
MSTSYPSNLSDAEWECLQRYLPPQPKRGRPPTHSQRSIFNAIFYVLRYPMPPFATYQPISHAFQTVFYHFRRLRDPSTWFRLLTTLREAERERVGRNSQPSAAIIDAQSIKTVEESAGICGFDAHKCVKGRKRHILVDTLGLLLAVYVTPADLHDGKGARCLLGFPRSIASTSEEDLGGCRVPGPGTGRLVPD